MLDPTYLDKNMPDRCMHNIYRYGLRSVKRQVVSQWNCESLVGHILLALEDLDPTYQRGGPLGEMEMGRLLSVVHCGWRWISQSLDSGLGVFRSYTATRSQNPIFHLTGSYANVSLKRLWSISDCLQDYSLCVCVENCFSLTPGRFSMAWTKFQMT